VHELVVSTSTGDPRSCQKKEQTPWLGLNADEMVSPSGLDYLFLHQFVSAPLCCKETGPSTSNNSRCQVRLLSFPSPFFPYSSVTVPRPCPKRRTNVLEARTNSLAA
jgi:hypothetical protein